MLGNNYHDIDLPVASLQINATKFQTGPRMSYEQWHALPDDAKKIWDMLSPEAKLIILHPFLTNQPLKPPYFGNRKPPLRQQHALPPCQTINNIKLIALHHVFMNFMGETHHLKLHLTQPLNPLMVSLQCMKTSQNRTANLF